MNTSIAHGSCFKNQLTCFLCIHKITDTFRMSNRDWTAIGNLPVKQLNNKALGSSTLPKRVVINLVVLFLHFASYKTLSVCIFRNALTGSHYASRIDRSISRNHHKLFYLMSQCQIGYIFFPLHL
jgi:hypothetical protein